MVFKFPPGIVPNLFFDLPKNNFVNRKCQNLAFSNFSRDFWHLAKNISSNFTSSSFPFLLNPDGSTAVSSISKAELFSHTLCKNSTLDDFGHIPPTYPPSDSFMPVIKILHNDVFYALSGLNPQKVYGPDGVPPIIPKNCADTLPDQTPSALPVNIYFSFLLEVCLRTACT